TDEVSWEKAELVLERTKPRLATARASDTKNPFFGKNATNVGAVRLRAVAAKGELHDRCLWTPLARELGGQGSTTSLVGSYETVAAALLDYTEIGCDLLSIRGWDVWNDMVDYGLHVLPLIRQELAHREATGSGPILNPDSRP